jgi:hypothetical protein
VRRSLHTRDYDEAQLRRDLELAQLARASAKDVAA